MQRRTSTTFKVAVSHFVFYTHVEPYILVYIAVFNEDIV